MIDCGVNANDHLPTAKYRVPDDHCYDKQMHRIAVLCVQLRRTYSIEDVEYKAHDASGQEHVIALGAAENLLNLCGTHDANEGLKILRFVGTRFVRP